MARATQSRKNLFGWLTKSRVVYHRSRGEASHTSQAYRAGLKAGDTGAFEAWLNRLKFEPNRKTRQRLEAQFRRGVERSGQAERVKAARAQQAKERKEKKQTALSSYKGVRLFKLGSGEYTTSIDRDSHFDTLQDAKNFIASWKQDNPRGCARTRKANVSDRAKRYRANQAGCRPNGVKKCKLCGAKRDVMVDHIDGNESNGRKSNLRWLCRSCNNTIAAEMARDGRGRRTVQYNPEGAQTLGEYVLAVLQHTRGAHDEAGRLIHATPKWKRQEFASEIWAARKARGNPAVSAAQYRLAQAVLSGTARESHMSQEAAREIVDRTPASLRSEYSRNPAGNPSYAPRFIRPDQSHELINLYHLARVPLSGTGKTSRYERMLWASKEFAKEHPEVSSTGAYKDLDGLLSNPAANPAKSKGHLFFKDGYEWYKAGGEVYRAPLDNVFDVTTGYRIGRWEFPEWQIAERKKHRTYPYEKASEYSRQNPGEAIGQGVSRLVEVGGGRKKKVWQWQGHGWPKEEYPGFVSLDSTHYGDRKTGKVYARGNPANCEQSSPEYQLGYSLGQRDRETASLQRTGGELEATFLAKFDPERASLLGFIEAYEAGYGVAPERTQAANPAASDFDAGVEAASMYRRINVRPDRRAFLAAFAQWKRAHGKDSSLAEFTKGFRSAAAEHWTRNPETYSQWKARLARGSGNPEPAGDNSEDYQNAKRIAELFHGHPVQEEVVINDELREHDWYAQIGPLVSLKIKLPFKPRGIRQTVTLPFHQDEEHKVLFWTSPDGRQFYLRGGDQEIDLDAIQMGEKTEWFRDFMNLGEVTHFTYRDKKKFHKFKLTDYYHKVGSALDSTGQNHIQKTKAKPVLIYDTLSKKLSFAGGQGKVDTDNLVEGMSPGIVQ